MSRIPGVSCRARRGRRWNLWRSRSRRWLAAVVVGVVGGVASPKSAADSPANPAKSPPAVPHGMPAARRPSPDARRFARDPPASSWPALDGLRSRYDSRSQPMDVIAHGRSSSALPELRRRARWVPALLVLHLVFALPDRVDSMGWSAWLRLPVELPIAVLILFVWPRRRWPTLQTVAAALLG